MSSCTISTWNTPVLVDVGFLHSLDSAEGIGTDEFWFGVCSEYAADFFWGIDRLSADAARFEGFLDTEGIEDEGSG